MLLVPLLAYVLIFAAACSHSSLLRSLGLSKFGTILDYGYEAKHVDADILIFGDSSAFLGVDPRVVQSTLHLRTAVIPNTIGSLPVTGDLVLQRYLAHNTRPRLLVLYFSPWNLDYEGTRKKEFLLEGEEELLRYGSWRVIAHTFRRYPLQFLVFPFQTLEPLGLKQIQHVLRHEAAKRGAETVRDFGHWGYTLPYDALKPDCQLRQEYTLAQPSVTVSRLKEHYQSQGMQVAVYLAPIPDCTNAASVLAHSYVGVSAAPPAVLPPSWFADDSFAAHVWPEHVPQSSELLVERVREILGQSARDH